MADSIKSYARGFNRLVEGKAVRDVFSQWKWHNGVPNRPGGMYSAKRLWCALRDDLRGSDFGEAWGDGFPQDTRVLLPYLEITADLWNERFRKYAVAPWAGDVLKDAPNSDYDLDNIGAWEIRGLYRALWDKEGLPKSDYFPMQTDIAFDFAPKMCDNSETNPKVCANWCPFGKFDEGDKLCAGSELQQGGAGKKCPLLLYTCGLVRDCRPDECYIRNERLKEKGNLAVCAKGA